jgi:hypothetical protein
MKVFTDRQIDKKFANFLIESDVAKRSSLRYIQFTGKYPIVFYSLSLIDMANRLEIRGKGIKIDESNNEFTLFPPYSLVSRSIIITSSLKVKITDDHFEIRESIERNGISIAKKVTYTGLWLKYPAYNLQISLRIKEVKRFVFSRSSDINNYQALFSPEKILDKPLIKIVKAKPSVYLLGVINTP